MAGRGRGIRPGNWSDPGRQVAKKRTPATGDVGNQQPRMSNLGTASPKRGAGSSTSGVQAGGLMGASAGSSTTSTGAAARRKERAKKLATEFKTSEAEMTRRLDEKRCWCCGERGHEVGACSKYTGPARPPPPGPSRPSKRKLSGMTSSGYTPPAKSKPETLSTMARSYASAAGGGGKKMYVFAEATKDKATGLQRLWMDEVVNAIKTGAYYPRQVDWSTTWEGTVVTLADKNSQTWGEEFFKRHALVWETMDDYVERTRWRKFEGWAKGEVHHSLPTDALHHILADQIPEGALKITHIAATPGGIKIFVRADEKASEFLSSRGGELRGIFGPLVLTEVSRPKAAVRLAESIAATTRECKALEDKLVESRLHLERLNHEKEAAASGVATDLGGCTLGGGSEAKPEAQLPATAVSGPSQPSPTGAPSPTGTAELLAATTSPAQTMEPVSSPLMGLAALSGLITTEAGGADATAASEVDNSGGVAGIVAIPETPKVQDNMEVGEDATNTGAPEGDNSK